MRYYLATRWINLGKLVICWKVCGDRTYLKVLMVNVAIHAMRATNKVAVRPFCLWHISDVKGQASGSCESIHAHLSSVSAWNAILRLADSKTINAKSRKMSDILALCERKPRGFEVYSS